MSGTFIERARRAQIVEAAITTIAEEGYARASFVRIARRAGVRAGLISYHFSTRDDLIAEVLDVLLERSDRAMAGRGQADGFLAALERMVTGYVHHCAAHPLEVSALQEIRSATSSPAVQVIVAEQLRRSRADLMAFLLEGQAHGELHPGDAGVLADTLLAALHAVPSHLRARDPAATEEYAAELTQLFVRAAARTAPNPSRPHR